MLVPRHMAIGLLVLLLGLEVVVGVRGGRRHVATYTNGCGEGALHKGVMVAHPWVGHVGQGVGVVHVHREGFWRFLGCRAHVTCHGTRLLLYRAWGDGSGSGSSGCARGRRCCFLAMTLLQVARQVVTATKALGTARAEEVAATSVNYSMAAYIFAGVETPVTTLTRVLPLSDCHSGDGGTVQWWRPVIVTPELF